MDVTAAARNAPLFTLFSSFPDENTYWTEGQEEILQWAKWQNWMKVNPDLARLA